MVRIFVPPADVPLIVRETLASADGLQDLGADLTRLLMEHELDVDLTASSLYSGVNSRRWLPMMNIHAYKVSTVWGEDHFLAE